MESRTDDITAAKLIALIHSAKSNSSTEFDLLIELQRISRRIRSAISDLSREELIQVSNIFSEAFKPIGKKPPWAVEITVLIDRAVMASYSAMYQRGLTGIPLSEFTPHLAESGFASS
jgi:hypothetical protein